MAEYFLHVELIVPANNVKPFEEKMKEFLNRNPAAFKFLDDDFNIDLVMALKTTESFRFNGYERYQSVKGQFESRGHREGGQDVYRYVHLWRLAGVKELDIARVMSRSADDLLYNEIDALILRETQNLVLRVQWLAGQPTMDGGKRFVRVLRQFQSKDLGTYLFKVGALFPILEQKGYRTLGHFQNVTGELNTVVEFWQTAEDEKLQTILSAFADVGDGFRKHLVHDFEHLSVAEVRESLARAPYFGAP
jgi:hypothetical protein